MPDSEKDLPVDDVGAPKSDSDAPMGDVAAPTSAAAAPANGMVPPAGQSGPALPDDDAPSSERRTVASAVPAPANDMGFDLGVTRESLDGYLARRSTRRLVRRVVRAHVAPKTPKDVVDDIEQLAYVEAITAKRYARAEATLDGWMAAVAAHAVSHHFRKGAADAKWLRRDVEVEEQPAEPAEDLKGEERWMITPWLREQVKDDPDDRELFELLVYKARSEKSFGRIAGERGMTPAALSNRIYRFKLKYLPRRHRYLEEERRKTIFLLVLGAFLVGVAVVLYVLLLSVFRPRQPDELAQPPVTTPVVVPSVQPPPPPSGSFDQALPPLEPPVNEEKPTINEEKPPLPGAPAPRNGQNKPVGPRK